ncbi:ROK family transcriptional regulator [Aureimonas sp. AU20]|uniref:ROK family transcriptional regulator n=1 Tax=Aureimonas sp. AU20 TaxID=1349819 RepID=UPI0007207789|nr:ROK family transcriptional regulator [Aureimonas sp. AU20]ALN75496.1 hypothetical protein M673_22400 [Aureimonas sp. AU20]
MSMPKAVRHINEKRALAALAREGALSRADLARQLGLTRSTASSIAAGLIEAGMLREAASPDGGEAARIGRPGTRLALNGGYGTFVGVDLGIGHLHLVAMDFAGASLARHSEPLDPGALGPEGTMDRLLSRLGAFRRRLDPGAPLRGIGLAVPGIATPEGSVLRLPILGWTDWPAGAQLRRAFPDVGEIAVENDAKAFAFAEAALGGAALRGRTVHLLLDAGVGGAILQDGALQRGARGYAGEIGHMPVGERGFLEGAALPGSLESFVGREAILQRYRLEGGEPTWPALLAALEADEPAARRTLSAWSHYLGRGLASITALLDPDEIVLAGPVCALFQRGEIEVREALAKHLLPGQPLPRLSASRLGPDGAALGGARLLQRRLLSVDEDFVLGRLETV